MSEVLLGVALKGVPRDSYTLCTKLGRYDLQHFDFSAKRVAESVDVSLHRLGTDHLDIILCHDIEFVPMQQIVDETLPALRKIQQQGKVRFIGFSGYPMKIFRFILDQTDRGLRAQLQPLHAAEHALRRRLVPYLKAKGVGVMNAGPVQRAAADQRAAARLAQGARGSESRARARPPRIARARAWTSPSSRCSSPSRTRTSRRPSPAARIPNNIRNWAKWAAEPLDQELLAEVQAIFAPVKNIGHREGLPENN